MHDCNRCANKTACRASTRNCGPSLCENLPRTRPQLKPTPHGLVMAVLADHGPATAPQLQAATGLSRAAVYSALSRMFTAGYAVPLDETDMAGSDRAARLWQFVE